MTPRLYILLFEGASVISRLIEWQTRGEYSHAALLAVWPDGRIQQIEAWSSGVQSLDHFEPHGSVVDFFTINASSAQVTQILAFAEQQVGAPYDWIGDACFISRTHPPKASDDAWFCSELVFASVLAAAIQLLRATQPFEVSPALLGRSPLIVPAPNPIASAA